VNIRELSSQFSVYVFARDVDRGAGMKVALSGAGYDCFFFEDQTQLLDRIQQNRPHIIVITTMSVRDSLSSLVEAILKISPESRFVFLARKDQFATLAKYGNYGLDDILLDEPEGLDARIIFSVDRACERIYLTFQNRRIG
jgi:DNA-binding response OmpR family regulator